jgi:serine/threonine-protein kinase
MPKRLDILETGGALRGALAEAAIAELVGAPLALAPGERVGAWRIVRELGRGGMGVVYLADRADGEYAQQVALKCVSTTHLTQTTEFLLRERQILAQLRHPGIARLIDGGATAAGLAWFAMEYIEGVPLDEWCARGKVELAQGLALFLQICHAVQHAHGRLLIHGDIKPANILVEADGSARLLDFGIARGLGEAGVLGVHTPAYAAPEQARGEPLTTSVDVYQLGLTLLDLAPRVRGNEAEVPREQRRERDRLALPPPLRAVVDRAIHALPGERYDSVSALREEIERYLSHRPVRAHSAGIGYLAACFVRRHAAMVALAATALGILLISGIAFTVRLESERDRKVLEAARATAVTEYLVELFRDADPLSSDASQLSARALVERGAERLQSRLAEQPASRAAIEQALADVWLSLGEYRRAEQTISNSLAADSGEAPRTLAERKLIQSQALSYLGEYKRAVASAEEGLARLDTRAQDILTWRLRVALAAAAQFSGDVGRAESELRRVLDEMRATGTRDARIAGMAHMTLSYILEQRVDYPAALAEADAARADLGVGFGAHSPRLLQVDVFRAYLLDQLGRAKEAKPLVDAAVAGMRALKLSDSRLAYGLITQSIVLRNVDSLENARRVGEEAFSTCQSAVGGDHPMCALAAHALGITLLGMRDYPAAESMYREALRIRLAKLEPRHTYIAFARVGLAAALCHQNRQSEGQSELAQGMAVLREVLPVDNPDLITAETVVADCAGTAP